MNLLKRFATAAIMIPLVFAGIQYFPRFWFFCLVQVMTLAALLEFYYLPRKRKIFPNASMGVLFALIIGFSFYFRAFSLEMALLVGLLLIGIYYILSVNRLEKLVNFSAAIALTFFGPLYLSFTMNHFNWIRDDYGPYYIYFMLAVIFIGDSGALFFGKLWGKHKLAPIASPKKTWEGSIGGLLTGCLGGILAYQFLLKNEAVLWKAIVFAALIHVFAQLSDPLESLFKRAAGVKDSSNLLPGHGGFLDRIDSLVLTAPIFYYLLELIGMK